MKKDKLLTLLFLFTCSLWAYTQTINTICGNDTAGYSGDGGNATYAKLNYPPGVATDLKGNIYIVDQDNQRIREIDTSGIIRTIAGNGIQGFSGDSGLATEASLYNPAAVAIDKIGNVYIADWFNNRIRKINNSGIITTIAGNGSGGYGGDGGLATSAQLWRPNGLALDVIGNLYISDESNSRIRMVNTSGIINTVAGNGLGGYTGDGGSAIVAEICNPAGVAVDSTGNLYIADYNNNVIRKVNPSGTISTFCGNGIAGFGGDSGQATEAKLHWPACVATDVSGNIYVADQNNNRIRMVNSGGIIYTVAGDGTNGFSGDGGPAGDAELAQPAGIALDASGNLYIADDNNQRIRKVNNASLTGIGRIIDGNKKCIIYPSPASEYITIEYSPVNENEKEDCMVFDASGKLIFDYSFVGTMKYILDIRGVMNGIYFVKVGNDVVKFIKID